MEIESQLTIIENQIRELKKEYDLYFLGERRIPPAVLREKVQKAIVRLTGEHITNTQLKFRLHTLTARYNSFAGMWDRILYQIEQGTYKPNQFKADLRLGSKDAPHEPAKSAAKQDKGKGDRAEHKIRDLYKTFIETRRVTGENVNVPFESFQKSIEKNKELLQKKFGAKYEIKIAIEDGKAKVKGIGKK